MTVRSEGERGPLTRAERVATAVRYLYLAGVLIGAVGAVDYVTSWPVLTAALGPTAYVFAAHPWSETSNFRNALIGHATAVACGLGALAAFGAWNRPPVTETDRPGGLAIVAAVVAVSATLFILELLRSHHAPAAATALLIGTGLARPGRPLDGLVLGLAIVLVAGPLCRWAPLAREASERDQRSEYRDHP